VYAAVVARRDLDAALLGVAGARGVTVRDGVGLRDLALDGGVRATLDDGSTISARALVAADGHYSTARRLTSLGPAARRGPDPGPWHAARRYVTGCGDDRLWILFEPDLLPGYAWVFPLPDGRANVGFGIVRSPRRHGRDLRRLADQLLDRPAVRAVIGAGARSDGPVRAWPIPTGRARLSHGPVLFAGDAAGVVDPMTGEGIAQALDTGALAASALAGGGDPCDVARRYRASVEHALGRDLHLAGLLHRVLRSPRRTELAIRAAGATSWTRRSFARWLFEDYPRAALLTPTRWRRGMLGAPGAFSREATRPG
jgi:flavin-dependent dehydrogenase